ncbi:MAG: hypothetical protein Q4F17_04695 [Eubacteriales bacterium]|nr:hypothetical protein [Eubacteriales bacterium]
MIPVDFEDVAKRLRGNDEIYQKLYGEYLEKLENFDRIMDTLSFEDRCDLDDFITVCNLMDERDLKLLVTYYAIHGATEFKKTIW